MPGRLRVLIVTNLFPSNVDAGYAPFNRQQFATLGKMADVEVFGVVPWRFGRFYASGSSKDVVDEEVIDNLNVVHPRYPSLPGLPSLNASLMAAALLPKLLARRGRVDVVLASYAYPDGCAGVLLGRVLGVPVAVKCHGSDLNRVPVEDRAARAQMRALLPRARRMIVVSRKLGEAAEGLGVGRDRIEVVYNGIDRSRFNVVDRDAARRELDVSIASKLIVCVSHLAAHKGTLDLLAAAPRLFEKSPRSKVAFVGDGPERDAVEAAAERFPNQVLAIGKLPHDRVAAWMSASDVVCLPSWDEGMPNVVREAHAVGRRVVATSVGGIPEAVHDPALGRLVPARDPIALADALFTTLEEEALPPDRFEALAQVPTWEQSASRLLSRAPRHCRFERNRGLERHRRG